MPHKKQQQKENISLCQGALPARLGVGSSLDQETTHKHLHPKEHPGLRMQLRTDVYRVAGTQQPYHLHPKEHPGHRMQLGNLPSIE